MKKLILIMLITQLPVAHIEAQKTYATNRGYVSFFSPAPISDVDARNNKVNVKLNTATGELTVNMKMADFKFKNQKMGRDAEGKYLETIKYPTAGFNGKINGEIDYGKAGKYPVTATGILTIHGAEQKVTEKGTVSVDRRKITIQSEFRVLLSDYNIETPEILGIEMTADNVLVTFEATLAQKTKGAKK